MKNKKINIILVIIWMMLIFIMSSFNANDSSNQSNFIVNILVSIFNIHNIDILSLIVRKLAHLTEYAILGVLVYNLTHSYNQKTYIVLFISTLYAITDEIHQYFVPGRSCQITDIMIDTIGIIIGVYLYKLIIKRYQEK